MKHEAKPARMHDGLPVHDEYRRPVLIAWRIVWWFLTFVLLVLTGSAIAVLPAVKESNGWLGFILGFGSTGALFVVAWEWLRRFLAAKDRAWKEIEAAMEKDGVEVEGEVVSKELEDLQEVTNRWVWYRFQPGFVVQARDGSLDHRLFDLEIGSKVRIRYLPGRPEISRIEWPVPTRQR